MPDIPICIRTREHVSSDKNNVCTAGVAREFGSKIFVEMDSVEMRYFGQNNIRAGKFPSSLPLARTA